ncbi:MAG: gamma-glutamyl-gamma-aminobutyrate hydrolase family protein [bacterium]|nr:gamma-glutamyl-gamma-aminobutyrate hydrolase family protein [bacterium]
MPPSAGNSGQRPPLIGLPGRRKSAGGVAGILPVLAKLELELYFRDYARRVAEAGGLPVLLSLETDPAQVVERLDGIVLPGGTDVDPALYGAEPEPDALDPEPARDAHELALLDAAAEGDVPVLAICRGLQVVNVWRGGTLNQHVPAHGLFDEPPEKLQHEVTIAPGSVLAGVYGRSVMVNSLHHQTVNRLGEGLEITAEAPDGSVEGLECGDAPVVAVQWHPELLPERDPIFDWFVARTRRVGNEQR